MPAQAVKTSAGVATSNTMVVASQCRRKKPRGLADGGAGCVVVLHDLNLAARYCDHLVVLDAGRVAASGVPARVLVPETLEPVYHVGMHRLDLDGVPHLAFHPAHETHGEPHEHLG